MNKKKRNEEALPTSLVENIREILNKLSSEKWLGIRRSYGYRYFNFGKKQSLDINRIMTEQRVSFSKNQAHRIKTLRLMDQEIEELNRSYDDIASIQQQAEAPNTVNENVTTDRVDVSLSEIHNIRTYLKELIYGNDKTV